MILNQTFFKSTISRILLILFVIFGFDSHAQIVLINYPSKAQVYPNTPSFETNIFDHVQLHGDSVSMLPYRVGDKFGLVKKGFPIRWLVQPEYDGVYSVVNDLAIVGKREKEYGRGVFPWGVINKKGKEIVPCNYLFVDIHSEFIEATLCNQYYNEEGRKVLSEGKTVYEDHFFKLKGKEIEKTRIGFERKLRLNKDATFYLNQQHVTIKKGFKTVSIFDVVDSAEFVSAYDSTIVFIQKREKDYYYIGYDLKGQQLFHFKYNSMYWQKPDEQVVQISDSLFVHYDGHHDKHWFFGIDTADYDLKCQVRPFSGNIQLFANRPSYIVRRDDKGTGLMANNGVFLIPLSSGNKINRTHSEYIINMCNSDSSISYFVHTSSGRYEKELSAFYEMSPISQPVIQRSVGRYGGNDFISEGFDQYNFGMKIYQPKRRHRNQKEYTIEESMSIRENGYIYLPKEDTIVILSDSIFPFGSFSEGLVACIQKNKGLGFMNKYGKIEIAPQFESWDESGMGVIIAHNTLFKGGLCYLPVHFGYIDKEGNRYFEDEAPRMRKYK